MISYNFRVYIVESADGERLYTGIATDVAARVRQHNMSRRGAKATRGMRPVRLVYQEGPLTRSDALKRERVIKKLTRAEKLELISYNCGCTSPC